MGYIGRSEQAMIDFDKSDLSRLAYLLLDPENRKYFQHQMRMTDTSTRDIFQLGEFETQEIKQGAVLKTHPVGPSNIAIPLAECYLFAYQDFMEKNRDLGFPWFSFVVHRKVGGKDVFGVVEQDVTEGGKYTATPLEKDHLLPFAKAPGYLSARAEYLRNAVLYLSNLDLGILSIEKDRYFREGMIVLSDGDEFKGIRWVDGDNFSNYFDNLRHITKMVDLERKLKLTLRE